MMLMAALNSRAARSARSRVATQAQVRGARADELWMPCHPELAVIPAMVLGCSSDTSAQRLRGPVGRKAWFPGSGDDLIVKADRLVHHVAQGELQRKGARGVPHSLPQGRIVNQRIERSRDFRDPAHRRNISIDAGLYRFRNA